MNVLLVGCGVIGNLIAEASESIEKIETVFLFDIDRERVRSLAGRYEKAVAVDTLDEVFFHVDFVVEAASQQAARELAMKSVDLGLPVLVMSVGALVDDDFRETLVEKGRVTGGKVLIPSGAIAGLDGILAAREAGLESVRLTSRKPVSTMARTRYVQENGIRLAEDRETVVFRGSAREAVRLFPRSINVAAAVSLAGIGFDNTEVVFIADPRLRENVHRIDVVGKAGEIHIECRNVPSPDNPRTSYLAALSGVAAMKRLGSVFEFV